MSHKNFGRNMKNVRINSILRGFTKKEEKSSGIK